MAVRRVRARKQRDGLGEAIDPASIYVSWQDFAAAGLEQVVTRGLRLRGNHPAVQLQPGSFVLDGTPPEEWPSAWVAGVSESERSADEERVRRERVQGREIPICRCPMGRSWRQSERSPSRWD